MRLAIVIAGTGLALVACDATAPRPRTFEDLRIYGRQLFATPEECASAQAAGMTYCSQEATFCPDGRASVRLSDHLLAAEYGIRHDTLTLHFAVYQESPPEMYFAVSNDESAITATSTSEIWARDLARELSLTGFCE